MEIDAGERGEHFIMKKKIAMLLAAALCMGTFAGCGNSASNNSSAADDNRRLIFFNFLFCIFFQSLDSSKLFLYIYNMLNFEEKRFLCGFFLGF